MTTTSHDPATSSLFNDSTTVALEPRFEGGNICTWIGFKHVNYLVEEAVLEHLRQSGYAPRRLFEEHALGFDLVAMDTRILHALHVDDTVTATVTPSAGDEMAFRVTLQVDRDGSALKAATSSVRALLRHDATTGAAAPAPEEIAPYVVARLTEGHASTKRVPAASTNLDLSDGRGVPSERDEVLKQLVGGRNAFGWRWRIPYFYCHFTERLQMSGYLRLMEEVVDLFLAERGVSIKTMLDERAWIPVVPRSSVRLLDEALMEEDLYVVFDVVQIFKDVTYTATMDCYVRRGEKLVRTATGEITHGYAVIHDRRDWSLVNFDERMLTALGGRR